MNEVYQSQFCSVRLLSYRLFLKLQRSALVSTFTYITFKNFTLVINGPPQVVSLAIDFHEHLVQMPPPATGFHALDAALSDLGREQRAEPMPPISHCFMADIDATLMQKILDVPKRQRKPDVEHDSQTNDLTARFEIAKWIRFGHVQPLQIRPARLKPVCSESALPTA